MHVFCIGCIQLCDRNSLQNNNNQKLLQFPPIQQQAAHFHIVWDAWKHPDEFMLKQSPIWRKKKPKFQSHWFFLYLKRYFSFNIKENWDVIWGFALCVSTHWSCVAEKPPLDDIKLEVHQTASTHRSNREALRTPWPQSWKNFHPCSRVSHFNIAYGCMGKGLACYHSWWPI